MIKAKVKKSRIKLDMSRRDAELLYQILHAVQCSDEESNMRICKMFYALNSVLDPEGYLEYQGDFSLS